MSKLESVEKSYENKPLASIEDARKEVLRVASNNVFDMHVTVDVALSWLDEIEREIMVLQECWAQEAQEYADESAKLAELAHENAKLKRKIVDKDAELLGNEIMNLTDELKPCPFCGGEATVETDHRWPSASGGNYVKAYEVVCWNEKCIIYGADSVYYLTKAEAIEAWNTRAELKSGTDKFISINDNRKKFEADVRRYVNPSGGKGTIGACWEKQIIEFLDRQAAISNLEYEHAHALKCENVELCKQVDELTNAVNELQKKQPYCYDPDNPIDTLNTIGRYVDELTVERDKLQKKVEGLTSGLHKLLDLAHNAWSIAVCAMQGMPIPAIWGNAVEKGLRECGIDVDKLPYVVSDTSLDDDECENVSDSSEWFLCSVCGWDDFAEPLPLLTTAKFTGNEHGLNFCPNCKRKIKW